MKRLLSIAAVALLAAGCHNNPPANQANANPGTLTPLPAPAPQAQPAAYDQTPTQQTTSGAIDTSTPISASDASSSLALGGNYTVQHGDTLYHIALKHYGDGKQWKKIAAANPGVNPTSLKVGQTLVLP